MLHFTEGIRIGFWLETGSDYHPSILTYRPFRRQKRPGPELRQRFWPFVYESLFRYQLHGISGNHEFLIGGNHQNLHLGVISGDDALVCLAVSTSSILVSIQFRTEVCV